MTVYTKLSTPPDLANIGDFIRPHNPPRALTFVDELLDHCHTLADMPRAYPLVPRYEKLGIRRSVYRGYLIFYRIRDAQIDVIHILHNARDYESLLFPKVP